ncbi:MAG: excinuclease ABC subunit UvrA [Candidatus Eisenbacteria bacterium]
MHTGEIDRGGRTRATEIRGARTHNLQGIDCRIPLGRITAITGVSGSGKSTLAFDILYAEGQRRFVECLSAYARQFMERLDRPDVEHIGHIQPPIALKQRVSIKNARSTVGSITELSDYLRLLFAHGSEVHCLACGGPVVRMGIEEAIAAVHAWPSGTALALVAPLTPKPSVQEARRLRAQGFTRLLVDGEILEIDQPDQDIAKALLETQSVGLVVDRFVAGKTRRARMAEAFEAAWSHGQGASLIHPLERSARGNIAPETGAAGKGASRADARTPHSPQVLRAGLACTHCGAPAGDISPALFSWNSPLGACPTCQGFGRVVTIDRDKVVPDPRRNLRNHAVVPFSVPSARGWYRKMLKLAGERGIETDVPFADLPPDQQDWVFAGDRHFPGVAGLFRTLERKRYKMHIRIFIARFRGYVPCPTCRGSRLKPSALAATFGGKNIHELHELPLGELQAVLDSVALPESARGRVQSLLESIRTRLDCLVGVGVGYLTAARTGRTLSGGETQRIRIAAALGNSLTETLFILDEPTVGLHAVDTARMLGVLKRLTEMGNTVVVVEHDPGIIRGADHLIVLGPGGGREGGRLVYEGAVQPFLDQHPAYFETRWSHPTTGSSPAETARAAGGPGQTRPALRRGGVRALARRRQVLQPWNVESFSRWQAEKKVAAGRGAAREVSFAAQGPQLTIVGATEHNLRIQRLDIPLSGLVVLTGVSGSGKSTLLDEVIYRNWLRQAGRTVEAVGRVESVSGWKPVSEVHLIGQDLLGRSSRSNPLSFVKAYAEIRKLFAGTLAGRQRRLTAGAFSFNTPGGRCEACRGMGTQTLEMYFLPDVEVTCETCAGRRFQTQVLEVTWRGKDIAQVLNLTVDEATEFFAGESAIVERLAPLREVGLGYIILGQSTTTLSGGEAQRLKIAAHLAAGRTAERQLYLFDEPTTGLHAQDVARLIGALRSLIARGHGVIAVEHQLDFILAADWVVDLGPGPGPDGGRVVYAGPVAGLLGHPDSVTAAVLRERLGG